MKKVLAIVLSVAMLACFAIPAFADDGVTFNIGEYTVMPGEKLEVVLTVDGAVSAANFIVKYDNSILTFDKFKKVGVSSDCEAAVSNETEPGTIEVGIAGSEPLGDSELFQLNFTVKADAALGSEAEITLSAKTLNVAVTVDGKTENKDLLGTAVFNAGKVIVGQASSSSEEPGPDSSVVTPSDTTPSTTPSTVAPSTTAPSTNNPKTGDAGVAVFAGIVAAAAAAAFVVGKKKA